MHEIELAKTGFASAPVVALCPVFFRRKTFKETVTFSASVSHILALLTSLMSMDGFALNDVPLT